jgi:hypothetical protein
VRSGFLTAAGLNSELTLERVDDLTQAFEIYATILTSLKLAHCLLKV